MYPYDDKKHLFITSDEHYKFAQKHIKQGASVLDVGCGTGELLKYLPEVDYKGIDATKWAVEKANDSRITYCDVFDYNGQFDYVCAFGVLDTVVDLEPLAEKLKSLADTVLFSFNEGVCKPESKFKLHTKDDVIKAFAEVGSTLEFYKGYETYCIYRKVNDDSARFN